jgi:hypothetical protein
MARTKASATASISSRTRSRRPQFEPQQFAQDPESGMDSDMEEAAAEGPGPEVPIAPVGGPGPEAQWRMVVAPQTQMMPTSSMTRPAFVGIRPTDDSQTTIEDVGWQ